MVSLQVFAQPGLRRRVLVYEPSGRAEVALGGGFRQRFLVDFARSIDAAKTRLTTRVPEVVLTALPSGLHFSLLEEANLRPDPPIVVVMAPATEGGRIAEAFDRGARGYVPLPLDRRVVTRVIERELQTAQESQLIRELRAQLEWDGIRIPGSSLEDIERIAILRSLQATGGSTSQAARMLGISVRKIQYRLREWRKTAPHLLSARYPAGEATSSSG